MNLSNKEINLINSISNNLNSISELYELHKSNISSTINYYENMSKVFSNLNSSINFNSNSNFTKHQLFNQPSGRFFFKIQQSFDDITSHINYTVLTKLKDTIQSLSTNKLKFDKKSEKFIEDLKKSFLNWNEIQNLNFKKKELQNINQLISDLFVFGNNLHPEFLKLIKIITELQLQIFKELDSVELFFKNVIDSEYDIINSSSKKFIMDFPYLNEISINSRIFKKEEKVLYFKEILNFLFLELKSSTGPTHLTNLEINHQNWCKNDQIEPFYARVWETFNPITENEIYVIKKEMVKVLESGLLNYWLIEKIDGSIGYVPCSILEPIEEFNINKK